MGLAGVGACDDSAHSPDVSSPTAHALSCSYNTQQSKQDTSVTVGDEDRVSCMIHSHHSCHSAAADASQPVLKGAPAWCDAL